jgi:hypothetical protein
VVAHVPISATYFGDVEHVYQPAATTVHTFDIQILILLLVYVFLLKYTKNKADIAEDR